MKKIILVTDFFPYGVMAEAFLETEIKYWAQHEEIDLTIMPMGIDKNCRKVPENIKVDLTFSEYLVHNNHKIFNSTAHKILFTIKAFTKIFFWKELLIQKAFTLPKLKELLLSMRKYFVYKHFFEMNQSSYDHSIFYTYWYTEATYALQSLKRISNIKLVTRTHRFDLYEDATLENYMPLRRQFTANINRVFTITDSAIDYFSTTYGYSKEKIITSRLGVIDRKIISKPSLPNVFHIVSCSAIRPVKRLDIIIDVVEKLCEDNKNISFIWTHMGDGPLHQKIEEYATLRLSKISNIQYHLLGALSNEDVYKYYKNQNVDVFLNASESEGVPVSIMEAMSCHIPIVAPNVGGISDMINNDYNGKLLSAKPNIEEYLTAFSNLSFFKEDRIRDNTYSLFQEKYLAVHNYEQFIAHLRDIGEANE
ncbi:MAG: glycosyltransferase [Bacteroidales bacterium]|nr:glycosyltransferase [Bacteroidales bacterium]